VLATRSAGRQLVGGLLTGVGLAIAAGAGHRWVVGEVAVAGTAWLLVCLAGGSAVAVGGAATVAGGRRWPTMGARYERDAARRPARAAPVDARRAVEVWDALDRGEDPTTTGPAGRDRGD
jgi:uncharacterized membrane protein (TIGR02234 family)